MKYITMIILVVLMAACSSAPVAPMPDGSHRVPVNKTMPVVGGSNVR